MEQVHNTNHVFTCIQKLRYCSHHWTPHTFWQESSNSYVPHMGFHSHYDSTVLCQITRDTQKLCGHKSTMHPEKAFYTWKQRGITFQLTYMCDRTGWRWMVCIMPQPLYTQRKSLWNPLNGGLGGSTVSLDIFWDIHKSLAPTRIPNPDHSAPNLVTIVTTLSWLLTRMKKIINLIHQCQALEVLFFWQVRLLKFHFIGSISSHGSTFSLSSWKCIYCT